MSEEEVESSDKRKLGFAPGLLDEAFFEPLPPEELEAWGVK